MINSFRKVWRYLLVTFCNFSPLVTVCFTCRSQSPALQRSSCSSPKRYSDIPSMSSLLRGMNWRSTHDINLITLFNWETAQCYVSFFLTDTPTSARPPEREIICVSLKKDPKVGLGKWTPDIDSLICRILIHSLRILAVGIVIVGEDNTGKLDLGIFIASIVPGGPADRDGRIKPGDSDHLWW